MSTTTRFLLAFFFLLMVSTVGWTPVSGIGEPSLPPSTDNWATHSSGAMSDPCCQMGLTCCKEPD